jgi:hypothetical protein
MKRIVLVMLLTMLTWPITAGAQAKADFSGTWTMDPTRSESAAQATPIGPVTLVIRQNATELIIETTHGPETYTVIYLLDGSEIANAGAAFGPTRSKSRWDADKLVTESVGHVNAMAVKTKEVRSLDATGKNMSVQTTIEMQHGYDGPTVQGFATGTDVFVKRVP